ncbi:MAG: CHASE2 domain-containing protein [Cyanobacteria bacterium J06641_5]
MVWQRQQVGMGFGAIALVLAMRLLGWLQTAELGMLDLLLRSRWPEALDSRVVLVAIDENDIDRLGGYPLAPQDISQLLVALRAYKPAAIGLNLRSNDLADPPDAQALRKQLDDVQALRRLRKQLDDAQVLPTQLDDVQALRKLLDNAQVLRKLLEQLEGAQDLLQQLDNETIFTVEKAFKPFDRPLLPDIDPEQVGFSDVPLDRGGGVRRLLLGAPPDPEYRDASIDYLFSLSTGLATRYLATREPPIPQANGIRDPNAIRFGDVELPRVRANYGGYRSVDDGGIQVLFDPRRNREPFPRFAWQEIATGRVPAEQLQDRLVLVGIVDERYSELIPVPALGQRITGLDLQAHATSQILSNVLDARPPLRAWGGLVGAIWIGLWGGLGIWLGLEVPTKLGLFGIAIERTAPASVLARSFGKVLAGGSLLVGGSYGLLSITGLWVPLVPAAMALALNGLLPSMYALYRYNRDLRDRLKEARERQRTLEETFNLIHNGPLQRLALLLRGIRDDRLVKEDIVPELEQLNRELRQIIQDLAPETTAERGEAFRLGSGQRLDLGLPLHDLFDLVYHSTLERDFPGFAYLKLQVRDFDPVAETHLTPELKRQLCQFLEEALCNVGKHAQQPTRIEAIGRSDPEHPDWYALRVVDNGDPAEAPNLVSAGNTIGLDTSGRVAHSSGSGTRQAHKLAARLRGDFQRQPRPLKGTICQIRWPQRRIFRK